MRALGTRQPSPRANKTEADQETNPMNSDVGQSKATRVSHGEPFLHREVDLPLLRHKPFRSQGRIWPGSPSVLISLCLPPTPPLLLATDRLISLLFPKCGSWADLRALAQAPPPDIPTAPSFSYLSSCSNVTSQWGLPQPVSCAPSITI